MYSLEKLHVYAHEYNLRTVIWNRREYPGSSQYTDTEIDDLNNGRKVFLDRLGLLVGDFIEQFVEKESVPKISPDRKSGGFALMGWSMGTPTAMALFAEPSLFSEKRYNFLEAYVKDLVFDGGDPPHLCFGIEIPADARVYDPWTDPEFKTPEELYQNFMIWVSSYYDHPGFTVATTLSNLDHRKRTNRTTIDSFTPEQHNRLDGHVAAARCELQMYVEPMQSTLKDFTHRVLFDEKITQTFFPKVSVTYVSAACTVWHTIWAYLETKRVYEEKMARGQKVRAIHFSMVEGSNHFGDMACVGDAFAQCVSGKWALTNCGADLKCAALPLVNKAGTSIVCDRNEDIAQRFETAGVEGGMTGTSTNTTTPKTTTTQTTATSTDDETDADCKDDETTTDDGAGADDDDAECEDGETTTVDGTGSPDDDTDCEEEDTSSETASISSSTATATIFAKVSSTANSSPTAVTVTKTVLVTPIPVTSSASIQAPSSPSTSNSGSVPSASVAVGGYAGYKRQLQVSSSSAASSSTPVSAAPVTVTVTQGLSTSITSPAGLPTVTVTQTATAVPTSSATTLATTSATGVEPTAIVIGADGLRTVTVVSTMTVGCGGSTSNSVSTINISSIPVPTAILSSSLTSTFASGTVTTVPLSTPIPASSSASGTFSAIPTSSSSAARGFSFTLAPAPTPAPTSEGVNNGQGNTSFNVSELLTATVGP
ncbi:hypothetical protein H0H87_000563 [Tephrocybe sp. NHM501043]|nr:hypothetical protein H0H87_000563 [Tephrocybe sp. NHM501043]